MSDIDTLLDALRDAVGDAHVLVDADVRATYETDWLGKYHGTARCVVRPGTVEETAAVVRACAAAGAAIVPQGGNTGLVGGSVPRGGEVVLSTQRLTRLDPVDLTAMQVSRAPAVTIEALQGHARAAGVDFAVDWGHGHGHRRRRRQHQCGWSARSAPARCAPRWWASRWCWPRLGGRADARPAEGDRRAVPAGAVRG